MFFFFYPGGLALRNARRGMISYAIAVAILYRMLLALARPSMRINPRSYFENLSSASWEVLGAGLQSLFTPLIAPSGLSADGRLLLFIAALLTIGFWSVIGPGLETCLGRWGLTWFFLAGGALGSVIAGIPQCAIGPAFWLGHGATMFCMGAALTVLFEVDVKVSYVFWWFWGGSSSGVANVSALFVTIGLLTVVGLSQTLYLYPESLRTAGTVVRMGVVWPLAWTCALLSAGGVAGWLWMKLPVARRPEY